MKICFKLIASLDTMTLLIIYGSFVGIGPGPFQDVHRAAHRRAPVGGLGAGNGGGGVAEGCEVEEARPGLHRDLPHNQVAACTVTAT